MDICYSATKLLEWRNIYRNVLIGPEIQRSLTPEVRKRAHELLDAYGLGQFKDSRPSELSGGMRQRAALVRTLILNPEVLLLTNHSLPWIIRPG